MISEVTRVPAGTAITEALISAAEEVANEAESRYSSHELACKAYLRNLDCLKCAQLWADARETGRHWEALIAEHTRQQMAADHEHARLVIGVR